MAIKLGINGFGRIGRCVARALVERAEPELELVSINDLTDSRTLAHMLRYDSVHGRFRGGEIGAEKDAITIAGRRIQITSEKDPGQIPWKAHGVELVLECTGLFTDRARAAAHLAAGARKVLISAPARDHDQTLVVGVNDAAYDPARHHVISNGSCTTNCLAPIAKVLLESFGIEHGLMTTVHAYTNDQHLLDLPHRKGDLRRARAAAVNMIPTSTGAARALSEVLPALKGKLDGLAVRVPTTDVSLVDLTVTTTRPVTVAAIHEAVRAAAAGPMRGVLEYTEEELVSGDYVGHPASSVFDGTLTKVVGDRMAKVFAWYDNEWGFAHRMLDLALLVARKG